MAFRIKTNDTSPKLSVTLTDALGNAIGLAGCSVVFRMKAFGSSSLKVYAAATVVDETSGIVEYQWQSSDTATAGTYYGEIVVTYGDNTIETFPNNGYFTIIIKEDLD